MIRQFNRIANCFETDNPDQLVVYYQRRYNAGILKSRPDQKAVDYVNGLNLADIAQNPRFSKAPDGGHWVSGYFNSHYPIHTVETAFAPVLPAASGRKEFMDDIAHKVALYCALTDTSQVACAMFIRLTSSHARLHQDGGSVDRPSVTRGIAVYRGDTTGFAQDGEFKPVVKGDVTNLGDPHDPAIATRLEHPQQFEFYVVKSRDYPHDRSAFQRLIDNIPVIGKGTFKNSNNPNASVHTEAVIAGPDQARYGIILRGIDQPKTINLERVAKRLASLGHDI